MRRDICYCDERQSSWVLDLPVLQDTFWTQHINCLQGCFQHLVLHQEYPGCRVFKCFVNLCFKSKGKIMLISKKCNPEGWQGFADCSLWSRVSLIWLPSLKITKRGQSFSCTWLRSMGKKAEGAGLYIQVIYLEFAEYYCSLLSHIQVQYHSLASASDLRLPSSDTEITSGCFVLACLIDYVRSITISKAQMLSGRGWSRGRKVNVRQSFKGRPALQHLHISASDQIQINTSYLLSYLSSVLDHTC